MKNIYVKVLWVLLISTCFVSTSSAQSPAKISYQAVIRDADNQLLTNSQVGMQISILQGASDGLPVYVETQSPTTNDNGLLSIEIGDGSSVDDLSAIDWADGPYFIKTETDPLGGTDYSITGTSQLLSVPYALHAQTAKTALTAQTISGSINETDPLFKASVASAITANDTTRWSTKTEVVVENDPVFENSIAGSITANDTALWNNKLSEEVDGSVTNEIELPSQLSVDKGKVLKADGSGKVSWEYQTKLTEYQVDFYVADNGFGQADSIVANKRAIEVLQSELNSGNTSLAGLIDQEITDRTNDVNAEETARIAADAAINTEMDADSTYLKGLIDDIAADGESSVAAFTTKISSDSTYFETVISDEETARLAADEVLSTKITNDSTYFESVISDEESTRLAADAALSTKIQSDSTYLKGLIDQEITDRTNDVNAEEAARIAADAAINTEMDADSTYLKGLIDSIAADGESSDVVLTTKISSDSIYFESVITNEETARLAADAALSTKITNDSSYFESVISDEETARLAADAALSTKITNDSTYLKGLIDKEITNRTNDVNAEETARIAADAAINIEMDADSTYLKGLIDGIAADGESSNNVLTTKITNDSTYFENVISDEETARLTADQALFTKITNDSTYLKGLIDKEIIDRTNDVDTEETARVAADNTLSAKILSDSTALRTLINSTQQAVSTIQTNTGGLQTELDSTQSGAGLGTDGSYTANSSANYIAAASSLKDADNKLDAQLESQRIKNWTESTFGDGTTIDYSSRFVATGTGTNIDAAITPKGNGAIVAQSSFSNIADNRGNYAVDLQMERSSSDQVASGNNSVVIGRANKASGAFSSALGYNNTASNTGSSAIGYSNTASGQYSTALGYTNTASGTGSSAIGKSNTAGPSATAMGESNTASGAKAFAVGYQNVAFGDYSSALGRGNYATEAYSTAAGYMNHADGMGSVSMGLNNDANSYGEVVLGVNATAPAGSATANVATDRLLAVGNGISLSARSDALSILKNGNTTVGGTLKVNGNGTNTDYTLPANRGTSGQVLTTAADGTTSWANQTDVSSLATISKVAEDSTYLKGLIDAEEAARITADNTLSSKIQSDSTTLRTLIDTNEQAIIDTAASIRAAMDTMGGLTNWAESTGGDATVGYNAKFTPNVAQTNVNVVIQPKGMGAILAQQPDGTKAGGNARGTYAIDLQLARDANTQVASSYFSTVGGGFSNTASQIFATVGGGSGNIASGYYATVPGGLENTASETYATVGGGYKNTASARSATVGGGENNIASGSFSLATGNNNTAHDYGETVIGHNATVATGSSTSIYSANRLFAIGNGTSTTDRSDAITVMQNGNTSISGILEVNSGIADSTYTLPANRGTSGQVLTTAADGTTSWADAAGGSGGGLTNWAEIAGGDSTNYLSNYYVAFSPNSAQANVDAVVAAKGEGAIRARSAGSDRGDYAVDLQVTAFDGFGSDETRVAAGMYATISGGVRNHVSTQKATIGGGYKNTIDSDGHHATIAGGRLNHASKNSSTIGGGDSNTASGGNSTISGGYGNTASGLGSTVGGGGGVSQPNIASGQYSTISGGIKNTASGITATIIGGAYNTASGDWTTAGGYYNIASSYGETALGMHSTEATGQTAGSFVPTDRLFVIGNGTASNVRSDALSILKNANTTIGGTLKVNGNGTNTDYTLPANRGTSGQVLTTAADGTTSWATSGGGSGLSAFGYCYNLGSQTVAGGADVSLANNGPLTNVSHTAGTTAITVATAGTYKIDYNVTISSGVGSAIAIAVNGTVDASTVKNSLTATGENHGTAILILAAGDVITIRNNSVTPFTTDAAPGVGAQITITKID